MKNIEFPFTETIYLQRFMVQLQGQLNESGFEIIMQLFPASVLIQVRKKDNQEIALQERYYVSEKNKSEQERVDIGVYKIIHWFVKLGVQTFYENSIALKINPQFNTGYDPIRYNKKGKISQFRTMIDSSLAIEANKTWLSLRNKGHDT